MKKFIVIVFQFVLEYVVRWVTAKWEGLKWNFIHQLLVYADDVYLLVEVNTGCPRRKGPNFGRVFLRSNYTDITQNTYIQSSMVTEILNIEK